MMSRRVICLEHQKIHVQIFQEMFNMYLLCMAELLIRQDTEDTSKVIFLFFNENIGCDPSLEPSQGDGSNDGSQNVFLWSNSENYL